MLVKEVDEELKQEESAVKNNISRVASMSTIAGLAQGKSKQLIKQRNVSNATLLPYDDGLEFDKSQFTIN